MPQPPPQCSLNYIRGSWTDFTTTTATPLELDWHSPSTTPPCQRLQDLIRGREIGLTDVIASNVVACLRSTYTFPERPLHINVLRILIPLFGASPCDVRTQLTRSPRSWRKSSHTSSTYLDPQAHRSTVKLANPSFCVSALQRLQRITFFAVLFMPTQYSCVAGCSKTYEKSSSLAHHKNRCSFALELRRKSQEIRAQKGDNGFPEHMNISERTRRFVVCYRFIEAQNR